MSSPSTSATMARTNPSMTVCIDKIYSSAGFHSRIIRLHQGRGLSWSERYSSRVDPRQPRRDDLGQRHPEDKRSHPGVLVLT